MFYQKYIPIFLSCFGFIHLLSLTDPCLVQPCNFGEICERSIDGLSYNCIKENALHSTDERFYNNPIDYFRQFFDVNPCISSPCKERQVCRILNVNRYVCVNELELPNDIPTRLTSTQRSNGFLKRLKASRPKVKTQKVIDEDEDYFMDIKTDDNFQEDEVIAPEITENNQIEDVQQTADACINQPNGKRLVNPLDTNTYIECQKNVSSIKTCLFNLVFNSHIEKCSRSVEKPTVCSPNPCMNGARCVDMPESKYKCQCRIGFTGNHCENKDVCPPNACGSSSSGGVCLSIGYNSPINHLCWCQKGQSIGLDCNKTMETNPCNNVKESKDIKFGLKLNPSVYVLCDGTNKPQIKFCQHPLVYSEAIGDCDWAEYKK